MKLKHIILELGISKQTKFTTCDGSELTTTININDTTIQRKYNYLKFEI